MLLINISELSEKINSALNNLLTQNIADTLSLVTEYYFRFPTEEGDGEIVGILLPGPPLSLAFKIIPNDIIKRSYVGLVEAEILKKFYYDETIVRITVKDMNRMRESVDYSVTVFSQGLGIESFIHCYSRFKELKVIDLSYRHRDVIDFYDKKMIVLAEYDTYRPHSKFPDKKLHVIRFISKQEKGEESDLRRFLRSKDDLNVFTSRAYVKMKIDVANGGEIQMLENFELEKNTKIFCDKSEIIVSIDHNGQSPIEIHFIDAIDYQPVIKMIEDIFDRYLEFSKNHNLLLKTI